MRRVSDIEAQQALVDEQEADIGAVNSRLTAQEKRATAPGAVEKELQLGEEAAKPVPLAPRPWLRSVAYTRGGLVAVPKKPYHQTAQLVGANNVAFDVSYSPLFLGLDTVGLTGDRTHTIRVFAGQEIWMRSQVIDGALSVIIEPYLGAVGQTLTTSGNGFTPSVAGTGSATRKGEQ